MPYLEVACIVLSYLLGAVPFGYLIAKARGVDIVRAGSGNIGATNVGRVIGKKFGILVFVLDFLKGAIPTAVAGRLFPEHPWAAIASGLAAFLGHVFPVYLRFRGGKGVATGCGVVAVLMPAATAIALLVWTSITAATRYVALASVVAAIVLATSRLLSVKEPFRSSECMLSGFALLAAALIVVRHRSNLARLMRGDEGRINDTPRLRMLTRVLHILSLGLWFGAGAFFAFVVARTLFQTLEPQQAGVAISPMFPPYFALQGVCGLVALTTAWGWTRTHPDRVNRIRFVLIALALALVLAGWPLVGKVEGLRLGRYSTDEAIADAAKSAFGLWHTMSLLVNFAVLGLVTAALALAARLPSDPPAPPPAQAG